jgi:glycosyltransferase involved in cell wall biosynthesis
MIKGKATICVVNYKTLELTRLCLRSIRKFTKYPYEVIVVDNDSRDDSLEYLKRLSWIRLIERRGRNDLSGGYAHAAALDLGLANCNTEFFVSMHSDAFVKKDGWLTNLVGYFNNDDNVACVGSGKLDLAPAWRVILKKATDLRAFNRRLLGKPDSIGKSRYYNRTICCIYRTDILRKENLSFLMDTEKGLTGGKRLYFELVDRGYKTVELATSEMSQYIVHLAHATQAVNRQEFNLRKRTIKKCNGLIAKVMSSVTVQRILADSSLDL